MAPALGEKLLHELKTAERDPRLKTVGLDSRFPNQNQTRYCYQMYLDFHRCQKKRGAEYEACKYFKHAYEVMCPGFWVEKWDEQIENGTFPGQI